MGENTVPSRPKPPSLRAIRFVGFVTDCVLIFAIIDMIVGAALGGLPVGSLILLVVAFLGRGIVKDMKRFHRPATLDEIWLDAQGSTYRSFPIETAFNLVGCWLPLAGVLLVVIKGALFGEGESFVAIPSALLGMTGMLFLLWRRKWLELRFEQVQSARDRLADEIVDRLRQPGANIGDLLSLPGRPTSGELFLYLRPFKATGSFRAEGIDLEVRLADAVAAWAPLVALGEPGEARGAGRKKVTDEEWRQVIELAVEAAHTIFVMPGDQDGIRWELQLLVAKRAIDRVVFIQPPDSHHFNQEWWERSRQVLRAEGLDSPTDLKKDHGSFFVLDSEGEIQATVRFKKQASLKQLHAALVALRSQIDYEQEPGEPRMADVVSGFQTPSAFLGVRTTAVQDSHSPAPTEPSTPGPTAS